MSAPVRETVRLGVEPGLYAYVLGLMAEGGVSAQPVGAAEFVVAVDDLSRLTVEQAAELEKVTGYARPGVASETDGGTPAPPAVAAPPRAGPGSGRDAWASYAAQQGVQVPSGATRDEIIGLTEGHG